MSRDPSSNMSVTGSVTGLSTQRPPQLRLGMNNNNNNNSNIPSIGGGSSNNSFPNTAVTMNSNHPPPHEEQVKSELWLLHCSQFVGEMQHSSPHVEQIERSMHKILRRYVPLNIRWNTSTQQPGQRRAAAAVAAGGVGGGGEIPSLVVPVMGGVGVRASLFSTGSEERDKFLGDIDRLYERAAAAAAASAAASGAASGTASAAQRSRVGTQQQQQQQPQHQVAGSSAAFSTATSAANKRPVWFYAECDFVFDPPKMERDIVTAFSRTPGLMVCIITYLRALIEFRESGQRVFVSMRLVPSMRVTPTPYSSLGQSLLGQLVTLTGTVVRIGTSVSVCTRMMFECQQCGHRVSMAVEGTLEYPAECSGSGGKCKSRQFSLLPSDPEVAAPSVQYAKLQEEQDPSHQGVGANNNNNINNSQTRGSDGGSQPRYAPIFDRMASTNRGGGNSSSSGGAGGGAGGDSSTNKRQLVEICLKGSMKDTISPGDNIAVLGILSKRKQDQATKETRGTLIMTCDVLGLRVLKMSGNAISVNNKINALHHQQLLAQAQKKRQQQLENGTATAQAVLPTGTDSQLFFAQLNGDSQIFAALGGDSSQLIPGTPLGAAAAAGAGGGLLAGRGSSAAADGLIGAAAANAGAFAALSALRVPPGQRVDLLPMLVQRFCPSIYGHVRTKAALILALVGGSEKPWPEAPRSQIHVLMLGDAGIGKSQLLRATWQASRRGVFVTANASSAVGLTVSMSRSGSDGTVCEAGAVLHGDGGVTCIDEIDKGGNEQKALLEVMEQNSVSVAKAGLVFSMPVHTSIISAGNPVSGRFDPHKTFAENVGLSSALVSRFDFVMLLADQDGAMGGGQVTEQMLHGDLRPIFRPFYEAAQAKRAATRGGPFSGPRQNNNNNNNSDFHNDMMGGGSVAEHVLASHRMANNNHHRNPQQYRHHGRNEDGFATPNAPPGSRMNSMAGHQQQPPGQSINPALHNLFGYENLDSLPEAQQLLLSTDVRTAIELCRGRTPLINRAAQNILLNAYVEARRVYFEKGTQDSAEITPRYLQSLIRVTEARAKLALADPAEEEHARFAVELLSSTRSVSSVTGMGAALRDQNKGGRGGGGGGGAKGRGPEPERALAALLDEAERNGRDGKPILTRGTCERILRDLPIRNPEAMIEKLNASGKLIGKPGNCFEVRQ